MPGPAFIRGESVDLCPAEAEDVDFLLRNRNDPDIRAWMPRAHPTTRAEVEEWIADTDRDATVLLGVVDGDPVGSISLFDVYPESGFGRLSAWVDPAYHGQGYGSEMTELMIDYAFANRRLHKLAAGALETNEPSRGLLESVGFQQEGHQREVYHVNGEYVDRIVYGMTEDDWQD